MSTRSIMSTKGQGHSLTLVTDLGPSHSDLVFSNFFTSITAKTIKAKFHMKPSWDGQTKMCLNGLGDMIAAMPVYGKIFKRSSSLEPNVLRSLLK